MSLYKLTAGLFLSSASNTVPSIIITSQAGTARVLLEAPTGGLRKNTRPSQCANTSEGGIIVDEKNGQCCKLQVKLIFLMM